jgi:formylmethanofuran dehydrogenase subunit C
MLKFELRQPVRLPVEVFGTSPDRLAALSLESVRQQKVYVGNRPVNLDSLFDVSGEASDCQQEWIGALQGVAGIGHQMTNGWIRITGDAGNHVGTRMTDGTIHAKGNVGNCVGSEMSGGLIHVRGNAGSAIGAALPGSRVGLNGGTILIEGSAGSSLGQSMRRGLIAVAGDVGNCCGNLMRAGTIVIGGGCGKNLGAEMIRGTIVSLQVSLPAPAGFEAGGVQPMLVVALIDRHLKALGMNMPLSGKLFEIYHGDRLHGARGELLVAAD